ncbi:hypothetical protein ACFSX9_12510 [Flavobacterium ardleyense]|uniref:Uncharacterized protein n=1 Tax=Flavobacterium ardleyense TaxID=2038737 RepID=A0ABW5Z9Y8_9FLAO
MKTILKQTVLSLFFITLFSCSVEDGKDGKDGINGADGQGNSGLTYVYINGNITDAEAIVKIQNEVGANTQFIYVENTTALTTLNLVNLTEVAQIQISNNAALTNLNLSNLVKLNSYFIFNNNPLVNSLNLSNLTISRGDFRIHGSENLNATSLQQIDLSALAEVNNFTIEGTNSSTLALNNLVKVNTEINVSSNTKLILLDLSRITNCERVNILQNTSLTTIDLSGLSIVSNELSIYGNSSLTNVDLSKLVNAVNLDIRFNNQLAVLNLPLLTTCLNGLSIHYNAILSAINMPLINDFYHMQLNHNNLDSNAINSFLNVFVGVTPAISGVYIDLSSQLVPAPPSGSGITNYNTLIAAGNTVITD